jgi:hypothetical protein
MGGFVEQSIQESACGCRTRHGGYVEGLSVVSRVRTGFVRIPLARDLSSPKRIPRIRRGYRERR